MIFALLFVSVSAFGQILSTHGTVGMGIIRDNEVIIAIDSKISLHTTLIKNKSLLTYTSGNKILMLQNIPLAIIGQQEVGEEKIKSIINTFSSQLDSTLSINDKLTKWAKYFYDNYNKSVDQYFITGFYENEQGRVAVLEKGKVYFGRSFYSEEHLEDFVKPIKHLNTNNFIDSLPNAFQQYIDKYNRDSIIGLPITIIKFEKNNKYKITNDFRNRPDKVKYLYSLIKNNDPSIQFNGVTKEVALYHCRLLMYSGH